MKLILYFDTNVEVSNPQVGIKDNTMLNFDWLSDVSPEMAKMIFFALFILIGILVFLLPNDYVYEGIKDEDRHWWNNLKYWSVGVLSILAFVYYIF